VSACALIFYKYTHFLFQGIIGIAFPNLANVGEPTLADIVPLLPPLGISFFIFEFVHYLHRSLLEMGVGWRSRWRRRELLHVSRVVAYRSVRISGVLIASVGTSGSL
jgi:D-alanyl-lipoteichoic acid acyltransferase DltB (MBOAT superfamily)